MTPASVVLKYSVSAVSYTHLDCIRDRGEICSNNACDLNCVCSFRMSFLYISNCSRVSSFRPFVCTCRMFMLLSMILYVWFASMRWFAKVDSVVEWNARCV